MRRPCTSRVPAHIPDQLTPCRVATWKLARAQPGGEKMVYISRILHRMTNDEVMDEVRAEARA